MGQKAHEASGKTWRGRRLARCLGCRLAPRFILPLLVSAKSQLKAAGRALHEKARNDF